MKGKYITLQILLACLSKPVEEKNDIIDGTKQTKEKDVELMEQWKSKIQSSAGEDDSTDKKAA